MGRLCRRIASVILTILLSGSAFAADLTPPKGVIPDAYFGLHIHHLANPVPTPWPDVPVPEWRLWDAGVTWPDIQPNRNEWHFERLDMYVSLAQQHGTGILLPLGGSPPWASARPRLASNYYPGFTAEPANMDDWRAFVRVIVSRYKGRIQAYEIWNEPNLQDFWSGTTDQMIDLTKEASQIIRKLDPHALVVSPAATADYGVPWLEEFLQKGGGQYVDVIGFHFYVNPHTLEPEDMLPVIQHVRQTLAENGAANKPIWNTETGWLPPATFSSEDLAAAFLSRAYILSWAAGVERFYWYAWDNHGLAIVTYRRNEHMTTPAGHAYKTIEQWLVGASMDSCSKDSLGVWTCQLSRAGKKEWIVWSPDKNRQFDLPAGWRVKNATPLLSNPYAVKGAQLEVGPIPVLLTGRS